MADTKTEPGIAVKNDGAGNITSSLGDPFEVGDCQMNAGATVTLRLDNADTGQATLIWDADVFTRHTVFGDQWHQSFNFKTRHGHSILVTGADGPGMDNENQVKHAHVERPIVIDPDLFDTIQQVDWTGEC